MKIYVNIFIIQILLIYFMKIYVNIYIIQILLISNNCLLEDVHMFLFFVWKETIGRSSIRKSNNNLWPLKNFNLDISLSVRQSAWPGYI